MKGEYVPPQLSEPLPPVLEAEYRPPHCLVHGSARASVFEPPGHSLWHIVGELEPGTEVEWRSEHGDEGIYVLDGRLEHAGTSIEAGSAVIVEAAAIGKVRASARTRLVHLGTVDGVQPVDGPLGAADVDGRRIHIVTAAEARRIGAEHDGVSYFTDGSCATCRIALFMVYRDSASGETYASGSHLHSEDEIIHVIEGEINVGRLSVKAGMSLAVPRNVRYGFRSDGPFRFINYRPDAAYFVGNPRSEPVLETVQEILSSVYGSVASE
jgi:quercetin dioxygenase-like cupin family protein